jgi:tRNA A37 threonylcarbamoyladenosine modification protein TsaB
MAEALRIPVVGVSLFEIAAFKLKGIDGQISVVAPFKRDACFVAGVEAGRFDQSSIKAVPWEKLEDFLGGRPATGVTVDLPSALSSAGPSLPARIEYDASDLLQIGLARLETGDHDDLTSLEPMYVLKSKAELRHEQRRKNQ